METSRIFFRNSRYLSDDIWEYKMIVTKMLAIVEVVVQEW